MALPESQVKYFADYVEKHLGIVYAPHVYYQLEQRLEKVASYLGLTTGAPGLYAKAVSEGISGDFKQFLLDTATNNETSFFRDPKVFDAIQKHVFPTLKTLQTPMASAYRFWCAAASFGQEPYSLAMLANEYTDTHPGHAPIHILATDIAEHALKRCQEAQYSQLEVQRGLSSARLVKYFKKADEASWALKPEIRKLVEFRKQNLLDSFATLGRFHLILCRYVLIYQDAEKKKAIVQNLEKILAPKGFLVFGASESAFGLSKDLDQISTDGAILYQKRGT